MGLVRMGLARMGLLVAGEATRGVVGVVMRSYLSKVVAMTV